MRDDNVTIIHGNKINPGERAIIELPCPKLYDWTPLSMPVHIIKGKEKGPVLLVTSAVHGDEINGIEISRRLLKKKIFKNLIGTLIVVPIVNVYGFMYQDRYLMDRRDLNRCFPGTKKGSLASRLADLLVTEVISKATHIIDLHTGSLHRTNLPQLRTNHDTPGVKRLANSFNVPVVLHSSLRDGSMRAYADKNSVPFLLYEAGEALRFDELSIKTGVNGILGVMRELKMLCAKKYKTNTVETTFARSSFWVRAPQSGICLPLKGLGKKIQKGELLAKIANPTTTEEKELFSPVSGIIIGKNNLPLVHAGAALFNIATIKKIDLAEERIDDYREIYLDESGDLM
jgi:hypothetical protein